MVTFRGVLRELERSQKRSNREAARAEKAYLREQSIQNATEAVEEHEKFINFITTVHKECRLTKINWNEINEEEAPIEPEYKDIHEQATQEKLNSYIPSLIDRIFKLQNWQKKRLIKKVSKAKELDIKLFTEEKDKYAKDIAEWQESQRVSKGILENDAKTYGECFQKFFNKDCLESLAHELRFSYTGSTVEIKLKVKDIDKVVPKEKLSQTSTGKLSRKAMPESKRNEIYQDYVCSTLLKVAREISALFPVEKFIVHIVDDIVNSATGHLEEQALLSALVSSDTLSRIDFNSIDASDCMKNFKHNMKFKKTTGLEAVAKIES